MFDTDTTAVITGGRLAMVERVFTHDGIQVVTLSTESVTDVARSLADESGYHGASVTVHWPLDFPYVTVIASASLAYNVIGI